MRLNRLHFLIALTAYFLAAMIDLQTSSRIATAFIYGVVAYVASQNS